MTLTLLGIQMYTNDEHRLKALSPMDVTRFGRVTVVKHEQPEKAPSPILVTLLGIKTVFNELQSLKASCPMDVTVSGMEIEVIDVQPEKALSGTIVASLAIGSHKLTVVVVGDVVGLAVGSNVDLVRSWRCKLTTVSTVPKN